jgi:hypothetical protein
LGWVCSSSWSRRQNGGAIQEEPAGELSPLLFAGVGLVCGLAGLRVWQKGVVLTEKA